MDRRILTGGLLVMMVLALAGCSQTRPPKGFTALFNGRDFTGWKGLVGNPETRAKMTVEQLAEEQAKADSLMRENWLVRDGLLIYDGNGFDNICTAEDYGDFELLVEWKIDKGSDSGIYLRGTPQVQIWDPGNSDVGSGGLFNNKDHADKPLKLVDNPVGEWNKFRIIMIGRWTNVYLNGELVVDTTIMENYWDRNKDIYETGPIELQAHNSKVYFRNIYSRKLN